MNYLQPPPMPAPVVVMKDVGGFVADYQTQTALYRATGREVRLHECRSACTMALSLPNVCVYPDSILKFHQAYDARNRQTDFNITQQLFDSYPAAVRARLGALTREYKILRGSELIGLGVRDCTAPKIMVASVAPRKTPPAPQFAQPQQTSDQGGMLGGLMRNVLSAFGGFGDSSGQSRERLATARQSPAQKPALPSAAPDIPLPPPRPADLDSAGGPMHAAAPAETPVNPTPEALSPSTDTARIADQVRIAEAQTQRRAPITFAYGRQQPPYALPKIITGSQAILPPGFRAYAGF